MGSLAIPSSGENQPLLKEICIIPNPTSDKGVLRTYADVIKIRKNACPPEPFIPSQTYNPVDFIDRQQKLLMNVTDLTVVEGVGKILTSSEAKEGSRTIMSPETAKDLGLIEGPKCLASQVDRTRTCAGSLFLYGRVSRPTSNLTKIQNRQDIVREIAGKKSLQAHIETLLIALGQNEAHMVGFENSKLALPGRVDKLFWKYGIKKLDEAANKNSLAVTYNAAVETSKAVSTTILQTAATVLLPLYALSLTGALPEEVTEALSEYSRSFAGASGPLYAIASVIPSSVVRGGMGITAGSIASLSLSTNWEWVVTDLKMEQMLHTKMLSVARYFRTTKAIYMELLKHPGITSKLEYFQDLKSFLENKDLKTLFAAFESRTFNSESGIFFQRGNVLFPWRRLENESVRNEFRKAIVSLAEIDTLFSTAKLMEKKPDEKTSFCFPTFLENEASPSIQLVNYWNPIVGRNAVENSIALGAKHNARNIVITGPNKGGKSTSLRSVMSDVVLAHSLGIAAASEMTLTPVSRIFSSMQTTDDAQGGDSLFKAQIKSIHSLEETMDRALPGEFGINALDEICTGTRQDEGSELAQAAARKFGKSPNDITLFATHFQNVTELAGEKEQNYVNYKVTAEIDGKDVRSTYLLTPGISDQFLGLETAAQLGLSDEIVSQAHAQKQARKEAQSSN